eukprot:Rmarinus@m.24755
MPTPEAGPLETELTESFAFEVYPETLKGLPHGAGNFTMYWERGSKASGQLVASDFNLDKCIATWTGQCIRIPAMPFSRRRKANGEMEFREKQLKVEVLRKRAKQLGKGSSMGEVEINLAEFAGPGVYVEEDFALTVHGELKRKLPAPPVLKVAIKCTWIPADIEPNLDEKSSLSSGEIEVMDAAVEEEAQISSISEHSDSGSVSSGGSLSDGPGQKEEAAKKTPWELEQDLMTFTRQAHDLRMNLVSLQDEVHLQRSQHERRLKAYEAVRRKLAEKTKPADEFHFEEHYESVLFRTVSARVTSSQEFSVGKKQRNKTYYAIVVRIDDDPPYRIFRREKDLEKLRSRLVERYPLHRVPTLKGRFSMSISFSKEAAMEKQDRKKLQLNNFLASICKHASLGRSEEFIQFLEIVGFIQLRFPLASVHRYLEAHAQLEAEGALGSDGLAAGVESMVGDMMNNVAGAKRVAAATGRAIADGADKVVTEAGRIMTDAGHKAGEAVIGAGHEAQRVVKEAGQGAQRVGRLVAQRAGQVADNVRHSLRKPGARGSDTEATTAGETDTEHSTTKGLAAAPSPAAEFTAPAVKETSSATQHPTDTSAGVGGLPQGAGVRVPPTAAPPLFQKSAVLGSGRDAPSASSRQVDSGSDRGSYDNDDFYGDSGDEPGEYY